jgi:hypothetical protein
MPSYKDSPKPLRKSDPNPLFKEADDAYIVKAASPMERQRTADGSLHSMNRRSSVEPSGYDESLYLGEDKIDKGALSKIKTTLADSRNAAGVKEKSVSAQMDRDDIDADEVVKAYMAKGRVAGADSDDEDEEKAVIPQEGKKPSSLPVSTGSKNLPNPKANNPSPGPYKPT